MASNTGKSFKILYPEDTPPWEMDPTFSFNWDLGAKTKKEFKREFEELVYRPVVDLVELAKNDPQNPRLETIFKKLRFAARGLVHILANGIQQRYSSPESQQSREFQYFFGRNAPHRNVMYFAITNLRTMREYCLNLIDTEREPESFSGHRYARGEGNIVSLDQVEDDTLPGDSFTNARTNLRLHARLGKEVPIAFVWQIAELESTPFHDTFPEVRHVPFHLAAGISRSTPVSKTPKEMFCKEIARDVELIPYGHELCALCSSSGVQMSMNKCSTCQVAFYCGVEHQHLHWPVHKTHCQRLQALKRTQQVEERFLAAQDANDERFRLFEERFLADLGADNELRPYAIGGGDACASCQKRHVQLSKCTNCKLAHYCGKDHQVSHWGVHKPHCERMCALKTSLKEELFNDD